MHVHYEVEASDSAASRLSVPASFAGVKPCHKEVHVTFSVVDEVSQCMSVR